MILKKNKYKKENAVGEEFVNGCQQEVNHKRDNKVIVWGVIVTAVLLMYLALVAIGSAFVNDYKNYEVQVYIPSGNIMKDTEITEQNVNTLFTLVLRDSRIIPSDYVRDSTMLIGKYTSKDIGQMEIICESGFCDIDMMDGIINPIEVSFSVSSFDQAVGGVLRKGDCISLYVVKHDEYDKNVWAEKIVDKTYVTRAFTSAGNEVIRGNVESANTPATIINIYIPQAQEEAFHRAVSEGTLRVSRIAQ